MNKLKIIVVAGAGFLGKALFKSLKNSGYMDLTCGDLINPEIPDVKYVHLNLLDKYHTDHIKEKYDLIINCGGQITNPINACFRLNSEGINNLVDSVKGTSTKLIHISSVSIFGTVEEAEENSSFNPETAYSTCKAFAEYLINRELSMESYCIIRLSNLYGYEQQKGILSYLFRSYQSDKKLFFNNDGSLTRYYLNVEDCSDNIVRMICNSNFFFGCYNLLGNDRYSVKELIQLFEKIAGINFQSTFESVKPYDNTTFISSERLTSSLSLTFNHSVKSYFEKRLSNL